MKTGKSQTPSISADSNAKKPRAKRKPRSRKGVGGRPTVMTEQVLAKLEEAFLAGLSDREACILADISEAVLYRYCNKTPGFGERKERLKEQPRIDAKITMARAVKSDSRAALVLLERHPQTRDVWAPPTVKQDVSLKGELVAVKDAELDARLAKTEQAIAKMTANGAQDESRMLE